MWPAAQKKLARFEELEHLLADPSIAGDQAKYSVLAREHGTLTKFVKPFQQYLRLVEGLKQAEALLNEDDEEMKTVAAEEIATLQPQIETLKVKIEDQLLIDPEEDFSKLIMEIRAGTGGDEAAIFAGDLYEMYTRYARNQGWSVESISFSEGEAGGFKEIVFAITGDSVYHTLRFESGGHRVQRVPKTETQGRIHTSAATVAILPEPDEVQIDIKPSDLIIETMRAGGAGGQHVNKTESAVRIWYRQGTPDQIEVKCQDERSQHKNRERAMRILRSRVYEAQREKLHQERAQARRTLIGSGDRSERIRTYNFPQNRLTDHRINLTVYKLDMIMMGELDEVIQALQAHDRQERLAELA